MMKRILIALLLLLSMLISAVGCGEYIPGEEPDDGSQNGGSTVPDDPVTDGPGTDGPGTDGPGTDGTTPGGPGTGGSGDDGVSVPPVFKTTVMLDGKPYIPASVSDPEKAMKVRWTDGQSTYTEILGQDGTATVTGLDGDYAVTLLNLPSGYTYNPNIYTATNDRSEISIELIKLTTTFGNGNELYRCIKLRKTGSYRAEIKRAGQIVFYEFTPTQAGIYHVESMVDISADMYNPILKVYTGTSAAKFEQDEINDGGVSGGYTKNFLYKINVSEEFLRGNSYTFAVRVEGKDAKYPTYVDFNIVYKGAYEGEGTDDSELIIPEFIPSELNYFDKLIFNTVDESHFKPEHFDNPTYKWLNEYKAYLDADLERFGSAAFIDAAERVDGKYVFNEAGFRLNPDDGYYHLYDEIKYAEYGGWGPILYASVSTAIKFFESPLNSMEYAGNKALTVSEGTENYKLFIEGSHELTLRHGLSSGPYFCNDTCDCYSFYATARDALLAALEAYADAVTDGVSDITPYVNKIMACRQNLLFTNGGSCDDTCTVCNSSCRHIELEHKYQLGYADIAVSGRVPVTEELKVFLQKLSESQRYFSDGNGWIETFGYTAFEESQWLFACGYYK